jgi:hypothetical protein
VRGRGERWGLSREEWDEPVGMLLEGRDVSGGGMSGLGWEYVSSFPSSNVERGLLL